MTPSFIGRTAVIPSGVRPNIRLASSPIPRMFPAWSTAATDGSFSTTPSPLTKIRVLAVPRSTASSLAGRQVFRLASWPRRAIAPLRNASARAAGLVPIATVTGLVSLLLVGPGAVKECRVALQISATIAFHRTGPALVVRGLFVGNPTFSERETGPPELHPAVLDSLTVQDVIHNEGAAYAMTASDVSTVSPSVVSP